MKQEDDERIRKELISGLKTIKFPSIESAEKAVEWIAWLEKQEGCEYIKKDWLEHIKQSWYKEGFIDGKYNGGTSKERTINDAATLKELIDFLENGTAKLQHDLTRYANWLKNQFIPIEKQGEQTNPYSGVSFVYNGHIWGMCARDNGVDILLDKQLFKHLEKQGEKKYIDDLTQQEAMDIAVAKCFEQGGQKPVDKVEPKFNIGDWIVSDLDDVNEDFRLCKIIGIEDGCYTIQSANGCKGYNFFEIWESDYHLWSIEDAKDGDILVSQHNKPFIYNGNYNEYKVGAYCGIDTVEEFFIDARAEKCWTNNEFINPATKEQCDTLFQKMHEAGYEWDAENKQLKKIGLKFKVGDLVVHDISDGRKVIRQIINMTNKSYILDGEDFNTFYFNDLENDYHLWTIQDAKPGDVLAFDDETIVIFKDLYNATTFHSYCHIEDGLFDVNKDEMPDWWEGKGFHPATKKQRDILFQKMHDAGYTFDFESKELKKIEPLTDFEKAFQGMCCEKNKQFVKECCKTLIELARKQLQSERNELELDETSYKVGVSRVLENPESYGLTKNYLKPSSSDIEALEDIMNGNSNPTSYLVLQSIIEQLKTLK